MDASHAIARLTTPIGSIALRAHDTALIAVDILVDPLPDLAPAHPVLTDALDQMRAYFSGTLTRFNLPLVPLASPRGEHLRAAMVAIPYGESMSYGALARIAGSAPRAIGQACRRNPYPIIIPCHRVHSSSGPEYYSGGGGATTKAWLVDFEAAHGSPGHRTRLL